MEACQIPANRRILSQSLQRKKLEGIMKAVRMHQFGGPDVLQFEDAPEPQAGPGEIRIRVIAAGVNPADWKMRENARSGLSLPSIPGLDVAGVVDQAGADVQSFKPGDHVFAKTTAGQGGYAEYTVVNASQAAHKPESINFVDAAAVPTAGLTAWQALFDTANLQSGQTVLIHGAAGGVGSFAVQLARWKDAFVIGTASGDHIAFVKDLGAQEVIDYTQLEFDEVACSVDVVLDTIGGETFERSWKVLKPGGMIVTLIYGTISEGKEEREGKHAALIVSRADGSELAQIARLIDEGKVKPVVTTVLPLSDARKAQEMSESHHISGKIVLQVAEEPEIGRMAA
jgi:NADPH:quinone reductase-like Zn-dependent oxidoreductase